MSTVNPAHSWFGPPPVETAAPEAKEYERLWERFMTARITLGLVLLGLQIALHLSGSFHSVAAIAVGGAYFLSTLATRFLVAPQQLGGAFNYAWAAVVGVDVMAFSLLQIFHNGHVNYTPLFALPILLASVLGSLRLALGTAAGVTVLLLGTSLQAYWVHAQAATYFAQAALSCVGYFVIAFLANQLANRLVNEGKRARLNQQAATVQRLVNELVIESLADGVIVVDNLGGVRAANPAARHLLGTHATQQTLIANLRDEVSWHPLLGLVHLSFGTGASQEERITLQYAGHGPRKVLARTRLTTLLGEEGARLCVLFLQDQRELEARMRTEKLASMGRMSTAVAHEIRNPLAAIKQANALLDEDISDPRLKKLTSMVEQNANRLGKIVDDVLDVSRIPGQTSAQQGSFVLDLYTSVQRICADWIAHHSNQRTLHVQLTGPSPQINFEPEHLRRVLVNLLDNAHRYASTQADAIQISSQVAEGLYPALTIWSDGKPMDQSVEKHLFEPFFSSESRSTGLGLYICRELCTGHGASIRYQRSSRTSCGTRIDGNAFVVTFLRPNITQDNHNSDKSTVQ